MISLTRKSDYALVALSGLASAGPERLSARALSDRLRLPLPALRNILKSLAHVGLVDSEQGVRGGYRLGRPAEEISVAEVVEVIEGPVQLTPCCQGHASGGSEARSVEGGECRLEGSCMIKSSVRVLHTRLVDVLRQTTIADLVEEASAQSRRAGVAATAPTGLSLTE